MIGWKTKQGKFSEKFLETAVTHHISSVQHNCQQSCKVLPQYKTKHFIRCLQPRNSTEQTKLLRYLWSFRLSLRRRLQKEISSSLGFLTLRRKAVDALCSGIFHYHLPCWALQLCKSYEAFLGLISTNHGLVRAGTPLLVCPLYPDWWMWKGGELWCSL